MARTPESAKRLAKAIVSDIALYNKDRIAEGIQNDNLFDVLEDEIRRGQEMYEGEVGPEVCSTTNFFNEALVDVLVKRTGDIKSKIW
jgi:hypothetical protein